jgi:hypothetical protein
MDPRLAPATDIHCLQHFTGINNQVLMPILERPSVPIMEGSKRKPTPSRTYSTPHLISAQMNTSTAQMTFPLSNTLTLSLSALVSPVPLVQEALLGQSFLTGLGLT